MAMEDALVHEKAVLKSLQELHEAADEENDSQVSIVA